MSNTADEIAVIERNVKLVMANWPLLGDWDKQWMQGKQEWDPKRWTEKMIRTLHNIERRLSRKLEARV